MVVVSAQRSRRVFLGFAIVESSILVGITRTHSLCLCLGGGLGFESQLGLAAPSPTVTTRRENMRVFCLRGMLAQWTRWCPLCLAVSGSTLTFVFCLFQPAACDFLLDFLRRSPYYRLTVFLFIFESFNRDPRSFKWTLLCEFFFFVFDFMRLYYRLIVYFFLILVYYSYWSHLNIFYHWLCVWALIKAFLLMIVFMSLDKRHSSY